MIDLSPAWWLCVVLADNLDELGSNEGDVVVEAILMKSFCRWTFTAEEMLSILKVLLNRAFEFQPTWILLSFTLIQAWAKVASRLLADSMLNGEQLALSFPEAL